MPSFAVTIAYGLHHGAATSERDPTKREQLRIIRRSLSGENWAESLLGFHVLYTVPLGGEAPGFMSSDRQSLRSDMLTEEYLETQVACGEQDFVEYIDGKLDMIYIVLGDLLECGIAPDVINELFREVHASNMTKVDDSGNPIINGVSPGAREGESSYRADQPIGKVLKGPQYVKPDIRGILIKAGWVPPSAEFSDLTKGGFDGGSSNGL